MFDVTEHFLYHDVPPSPFRQENSKINLPVNLLSRYSPRVPWTYPPSYLIPTSWTASETFGIAEVLMGLVVLPLLDLSRLEVNLLLDGFDIPLQWSSFSTSQ